MFWYHFLCMAKTIKAFIVKMNMSYENSVIRAGGNFLPKIPHKMNVSFPHDDFCGLPRPLSTKQIELHPNSSLRNLTNSNSLRTDPRGYPASFWVPVCKISGWLFGSWSPLLRTFTYNYKSFRCPYEMYFVVTVV